MIKRRWDFLIGRASEFRLEVRIFHSITLGLTILAFFYAPYAFFAGLYIAGVSYVIVAAFFFYEYYRSRFLRHRYRSVVFGIFGLLMLAVNYFANAGIEGSTDLIWPVFLLLLLTVCPYRYMVTWALVFIVVFGIVHVAEHLYPHWVHYPFRAGDGQFTDRITAFPIPVISMAIIIGLLRRNYDKERAIVEQRDAEKSRLLSILSHDLRAPFIQIQQYCELLNDNALSPEERAKISQAVKQRNDQTLDLVTNLLYWSHSQLEGFTMHLSSLFLGDTLEDTLAIASGLGTEKGISFETAINPEICVIADANMLQLVVRNILQNAMKFTAANGLVRIEAEVVSGKCYLSVDDNGTGITAEQMAGLFSGSTPTFGTSNEKGVGLGLQLCKEFMERQGGDIYVRSTPRVGSRFTIVIPAV